MWLSGTKEGRKEDPAQSPYQQYSQSTLQVKYATTAATMLENIKVAVLSFPKYLLFVPEVKTIEGVVVALLDGLELPLALILVASVSRVLS